MNLHIETYQRGEGWLAIACEEGSLLSAGRAGGGVTERAAIQEAINAFFSDSRQAVVHQPTADEPDWPVARFQRGGTAFTRTGIERALTQAVEQNYSVRMTYQDASGARTDREVRPFRIDDRGPSGKYMIALDIEKDEPRTFRVDRIEAVRR